MAAATATQHFLHDPFSAHHAHYSASETTALLDLLAVDNLIDSRAPIPATTNLLNDLLAVDLEFARADVRHHHSVATAPALKEEKDVFLDLLATDQEVDRAGGKSSGGEQHYATSRALHDPYVKKEFGAVDVFAGLYAGGKRTDEQRLKDDAVMMHLLAVDEGIDDSKRYAKLVGSDDAAIIEELHGVDREVSGAKRRALLVEDLQGLLDVDHLVDGVKKANAPGPGGASNGGKRSIFSVKEKYSAKVAAKNFA